MARIHRNKLLLCDQLEAIADGLPDDVDRLQCLDVACGLVPLLRSGHRFEEEVVFPAFATSGGRDIVVQRLTAEHLEDHCGAEDLTEILLAIGHGQPIENPEALGYRLRAFFETVRRHIAFERDHVLSTLAVDGPSVSHPPVTPDA